MPVRLIAREFIKREFIKREFITRHESHLAELIAGSRSPRIRSLSR
jgi:hypothetical protein